MSTLIEKIKKFFEGWCACGSEKKAAPSTCGEENKPQQEETTTCKKPEGQKQQSGS